MYHQRQTKIHILADEKDTSARQYFFIIHRGYVFKESDGLREGEHGYLKRYTAHLEYYCFSLQKIF
jgi:hypothetical protein